MESYSGRAPAGDLNSAVGEFDPPRFDGITTELSTIQSSMQKSGDVSGNTIPPRATHRRRLTITKAGNSQFVEEPFNMDTIMDMSFDNFLFNSGADEHQHYI